MGCDIHMFIEAKKFVNGEKKWINCDRFKINIYRGEEGEPDWHHCPIYDGRDYSLFTVLAGVRGDLDRAIKEPKGLPSDVTEIVQQHSDYWDIDGHTHSWLTLKELLAYKEDYNINTLLKSLIPVYRSEMRAFREEDLEKFAEEFRIVFWFDS